MKEILVIIALAVAYFGADKIEEGVIQYEQKVNLHRRIQNPEMKSRIPEFQTSKTQLLFNKTKAIYKNVEDEEEDLEASNGGGMVMRFAARRAKFTASFQPLVR